MPEPCPQKENLLSNLVIDLEIINTINVIESFFNVSRKILALSIKKVLTGFRYSVRVFDVIDTRIKETALSNICNTLNRLVLQVGESGCEAIYGGPIER